MKIVDKKKNISRMLEIAVFIGIIILTFKAIAYADTCRGYKAFGGEYLILLFGFIAIMIIETIYEESKSKKKRGGKYGKR